MTIISPATDWFEIVKFPAFKLNEFSGANYDYIYKSSDKLSMFFNNTWIIRYPRSRKFMFVKLSEFKKDFSPFLNYFDIKPVLTEIKNPQANNPIRKREIKWLHLVRVIESQGRGSGCARRGPMVFGSSRLLGSNT